MNKKRKYVHLLHYLYIPMDFVVTFAIILLSFLSNVGFSGFLDGGYVEPLIYTASISTLTVVIFAIMRIYRMLTSNFGLIEALRVMVATLLIQIIGLVAIIFIPGLPNIGRFVYSWLLSTAALILIIPSERLIIRTYVLLKNLRRSRNSTRTLIIGAGAAGKIAADEARRNPRSLNRIVGFVDDDVIKMRSTFSGVKVYGPISNVEQIIKKTKAEEVVIAIANLTHERLYEIIGLLESSPVRIKRLPLLSETSDKREYKAFDVSADELLGRKPVNLDNHEVYNMLSNKVVMVTGAGGSIGSELVRQIYKTKPSKIILFDIYENSTYDIQQELVRLNRASNENIEIVTLIGSTYNDRRVEQIIKKYKPDYIYHAAAYKHVPLMEDSPAEAIRTNVIGTYNVARFADKYGVKKMVLVSTDKAVRPTNVMGATKRFAETIIQYFSEKSKHTQYAAVRFGNVLGSNGSVIPLFTKQIKEGGPVTVTHKDIIRYFMTIPEAVALILQCGLFAKGGEIFILDMGKPVKIWNLAERLIRQAGYIPYKDIKIIETGLRPGEKLFEELLIDKEHQTKTDNELIYIEEKEAIKPIEDEIKEISKVFDMDEVSSVKDLLASIISTYHILEEDK